MLARHPTLGAGQAMALTASAAALNMGRNMPILSQPLAKTYRVALLGFSDFERGALASYFRLAGGRVPHYEHVQMLTDADYLIADADHMPSVQLVLATERLDETVFIGAQAPPGCKAWMSRPIDPLHVLRELDAMVMIDSEFASPVYFDDLGRDAIAGPAGSVAKPRVAWPPSVPAPPSAAAGAPQACVRAAARTAPTARSRPPPSVPAPARAPLRALLVDDSEIAQRFLEMRLQPWGLQIERAADSRTALEKLALRGYDMVFLDVELGPDSELDGLALCQAIKRSPVSVGSVVILVSAHHGELDRVRGALAGCDAYLAKPLDDAELARLLVRQGLKAPTASPA